MLVVAVMAVILDNLSLYGSSVIILDIIIYPVLPSYYYKG